jgi:hypothetical protein
LRVVIAAHIKAVGEQNAFGCFGWMCHTNESEGRDGCGELEMKTQN